MRDFKQYGQKKCAGRQGFKEENITVNCWKTAVAYIPHQVSIATDLIGCLSWREGTEGNRGLRSSALISDTQVKVIAKVLILACNMGKTLW